MDYVDTKIDHNIVHSFVIEHTAFIDEQIMFVDRYICQLTALYFRPPNFSHSRWCESVITKKKHL